VGADSPHAVDAFLQRATSSDVDMSKMHVFLSDLSGHARFGVIYGDYENADLAKAAARQLPAQLRANRPFPRPVSKLR
jgi:septal ring-binding cell division protein DamX